VHSGARPEKQKRRVRPGDVALGRVAAGWSCRTRRDGTGFSTPQKPCKIGWRHNGPMYGARIGRVCNDA